MGHNEPLDNRVMPLETDRALRDLRERVEYLATTVRLLQTQIDELHTQPASPRESQAVAWARRLLHSDTFAVGRLRKMLRSESYRVSRRPNSLNQATSACS